MKIRTILILILIQIGILAIGLYYISLHLKEGDPDTLGIIISFIQTFAILGTGFAILWYTMETYLLRKKSEETHWFSLFERVHNRLSHPDAVKNRRFLIESFCKILANAMPPIFGKYYGTEKGETIIKVDEILRDTRSGKGHHEKLRTFNLRLYDKMDLSGTRALVAIESVLSDFGLLALPACEGIESAFQVAKAYRPVLKKSAQYILPFIACQRLLRGDLTYQGYYLNLLEKLGILKELDPPLNAFPVPKL